MASRLPLDTITAAAVKTGMIWSKITISAPNQRIVLNGILNRTADKFTRALRSAVSQATLDTIAQRAPQLQQLTTDFRKLMASPRYLSHRDIDVWKSNISVSDQTLLARMVEIFSNPLLLLAAA